LNIRYFTGSQLFTLLVLKYHWTVLWISGDLVEIQKNSQEEMLCFEASYGFLADTDWWELPRGS